MSKAPFETLISSANSALVVVTTSANDVHAGCLVGYHSPSSIGPQHYCFWLSKANHSYRVGLLASHFVLHFLTKDDLEIARLFGARSGDTVDKFGEIDVELNAHGVPLITGCPNRMELERITILDDGGDHVCVTGRLTTADTTGKFTPFRLSDAGNLAPAHGSDERSIEP